MSRSKVVKIGDAIADKVRTLLGGQNPTPKRIETLLEELEQRRAAPPPEAPMPLDPGDIEQGRTVHRPQEHARILNQGDPENLRAALENLDDAERSRASEARERLNDRIAANEAKGLHRTAPPIEEETVEEPPIAQMTAADAAELISPPLAHPETASIPTDEADAIEAVKRAGLRKTRDVAEHLERGALAKLPRLRSAGRSLKTLEEAADALIAELEPNHIDAILQVCQEHGLPNWVVILGAIARMADLQELNAGEFRDEWVNRPSSRVGTSTAPKIEVCQLCAQVIPGARKGQVACCNAHGSGKVEHTAGCPLAHVQMVKGQWTTVAVP